MSLIEALAHTARAFFTPKQKKKATRSKARSQRVFRHKNLSKSKGKRDTAKRQVCNE